MKSMISIPSRTFGLLVIAISIPLLFTPSDATAVATTEFTRLIGTASADVGYGAAVAGEGVFVTGYTDGSLDGNTSAGGSDIAIIKYDTAGTKQWTKTLGTSGTDIGRACVGDATGNIYVAGYTNGNLDGITNPGGTSAFLTKYDSAGVKQWVKLFGTTGTDYALAMISDSAGNLYITGSTTGNLGGNTNSGLADIFIAKYDSTGNQSWVKLLGTTSDDFGYGIALDSSGNIFVAGSTAGSLGGNANSGRTDAFLAKYDSAGNQSWVKLAGTTDYDQAYAVALDQSGNILIAGSTAGAMGSNTNSGSYDIFTAKYDSSGTQTWVKLIGSILSDSAYAVATDAFGGVFVAGTTYGSAFDGNTANGSADIVLVYYSSSGEKNWSQLIGTSSADNLWGMYAGGGIVYLAGDTSGTLNSQANAGSNDIFLLKLAGAVATPAVGLISMAVLVMIVSMVLLFGMTAANRQGRGGI